MRLGVIAFLGGVVFVHTLAAAPNPWWVLGLPFMAVIMVYVPALRLFAWCGAGSLWTIIWIAGNAQTGFPVALESADLTAEGWIASIPEPSYRRTRLQLQVISLSQGDVRLPFTGRLRLTWYDNPPSLRVGDKWRLTVRLKAARGLANPGGFDYERWLWARGIKAQGYVRAQPEPRLLKTADRYPVARFRQSLSDRFNRLLAGNSYVGILTALAVGESRGIEPWQWDVFRDTGTSHLLAISGLHVGLIAGLAYILFRRIWSLLPWLMRRWPSTQAVAPAAMIAAAGYALLAGLSLPTQRALIMICVGMAAVLWQRPIVPSRILAIALFVILLIDPLAPLEAGFWLSFGAVAAIFYTLTGPGGGAWLSVQLAVTLALLPATLVWFQQIPILSPLANLIAIPWASVTVVPLTLLAVLAGIVSEASQLGVLKLAVFATDWLWRFLSWVAHSPWALVYRPSPPLWTLLWALPGLLLLLAPAGVPGRWLGGMLCLPLFFFPLSLPPAGAVWLTLLDVGQGLSAVIRTANHVLVYDTGPRRGAGFDAGRTALVPFLRQQAVRRLDTLIISHADNEHMGGTRALLEQIKIDNILTPSPRQVPVEGAQPCQAGVEWTWDGVSFRLLHPPKEGPFSGNDASCVLLVDSVHGRLLLAGDIEASAEAGLVNAYGSALAADVLVAPGQGAGVPLLADFLAAVRPRYVLFSTGYKNRFGFPRPETVSQYQATGAVVMDTASEGAISIRLESGDVVPESHRLAVRHYWRAVP